MDIKKIVCRKESINQLLRYGISESTAINLADNGYFYAGEAVLNSFGDEITDGAPYLIDAYYGSIYSYKNIWESKKASIPPVRTIWVSSFAEAKEAIADLTMNLNKEWFLSYRGMNQEYFLTRNILNPLSPKIEGREPSLLPSYWRKHDDEDDIDLEEQFFRTLPGQELIYSGIDIIELQKKNFEKWGFHTLSALGDDDDPINQEYYRRYQARIQGEYEAALLAQHYGFNTRFLDITFDLAVGLFFAAYRYTRKSNGTSTYELNINKEAAVYCFNFSHLILREDEFLTSKLFSHAFPERPKRQKCVGYRVGYMEFNHPASYIVYRIKLNDDFDIAGLPKPEDLFPSRKNDPFYDLLLTFKKKHKELKMTENIIEYEF